jgi:hypothetical protein
MEYTLDTIINFGLYKGQKTIKDILQDNPSYILWCIANVSWFEVSDSLRKMAIDAEIAKGYEEDDDRYEDAYHDMMQDTGGMFGF